jgi:hypothetical protein
MGFCFHASLPPALLEAGGILAEMVFYRIQFI